MTKTSTEHPEGSRVNRVLEFTSTFPRWEQDTDPSFVYELSRNLVNSGTEVDVLAPHYRGAKIYEVLSGIRVFRFRYFIERWQCLTSNGGILSNLDKNPFAYLLVIPFLISQAASLYRLLRKHRYDCVHAHWVVPQGFSSVVVNSILGKHRVPLVCTSHGSDLLRLNTGPFRMLNRWILKRVDQIAVVSTELQQVCMELGIDSSKIRICPLGVDLSGRFTYREAQPGGRRLLYVGRLTREKGLRYLLEAVLLLKKKYPDIMLQIVGDGPYLPEIQDFTNENGLDTNIQVKGALDNSRLPEIYHSSDILVLPSLSEGLGLVLVEAMGCGCAVIASDLHSIRDIIEDRQNGLLFEPGDIQALARCVELLITDSELHRKLTRNAREYVSGKFDVSTSTANYRNVFIDARENCGA